jgi:hypothetical protein
MLWRVEVVVDAILVVEGTAIDERACGIEQEDLGGGAGLKRGGERLLLVMHIGASDARLGELGFDFLRCLAGKGIHQQQRDAFAQRVLFPASRRWGCSACSPGRWRWS